MFKFGLGLKLVSGEGLPRESVGRGALEHDDYRDKHESLQQRLGLDTLSVQYVACRETKTGSEGAFWALSWVIIIINNYYSVYYSVYIINLCI